MREHTPDTVAALRGNLAELEAEGPQLDAVRSIVQTVMTVLDANTNMIVAATSIIAVVPGDRYATGFARDVIENAGRILTALETIDVALDTLLVPVTERHERIAHSIKAAQ